MKTLLCFLVVLFSHTLLDAQNREADSLILVEVFQNLNGSEWNNPENWLTNASLDDWEGIQLENDRVIKLNVINQNAVGDFPVEILGLDKLRTFEIRSAEIGGSIPVELTQLTELTRFVLSNTGIGGEMPNIWAEFDNLGTLSLSQNNLTGSLPDIGDDLTLLTFQGNLLTGPIPSSWEGNPLPNLNISSNDLTGSFDILSTWSNLIKIDLDYNDWDPGPFPTWIDDNTNLNTFSCTNCNLVGPLPDDLDFTQHDYYDGMFVHNNDLSGDITKLTR